MLRWCAVPTVLLFLVVGCAGVRQDNPKWAFSADDACDLLHLTNAQIERSVEGEGLHRTLRTVVWVSSKQDLGRCSAVLQDQLPTGAYVDPDELRRLERQSQVPHFVVSDHVDTEAGEWSARTHFVLFYPAMEALVKTPQSTKHTLVSKETGGTAKSQSFTSEMKFGIPGINSETPKKKFEIPRDYSGRKDSYSVRHSNGLLKHAHNSEDGPPSIQHSGFVSDVTWLLNMSAPVHARYHRARSSSQQHSTAIVRLPHPGVLLLCPELSDSCLAHTQPLPCPEHHSASDLPEESTSRHTAEGSVSPTFHRRPSPTSARPRRALYQPQEFLDTKEFFEREAARAAQLEAASLTFMDSHHFPPTVAGLDAPWNIGYPPGFKDLPTCYWLPIRTFSTMEDIKIEVPVGDSDQLELVLFVTIATTTVGTLMLLTPLLRLFKHMQH